MVSLILANRWDPVAEIMKVRPEVTFTIQDSQSGEFMRIGNEGLKVEEVNEIGVECLF